LRWENHFPILERLIFVEFSVIVIKASFPAPGISISCVGILHRTSHPSGSRHLRQAVDLIIANWLPQPLSVSRTQKISGSSPCPINDNNHKSHGLSQTLCRFTVRAGTSPNHWAGRLPIKSGGYSNPLTGSPPRPNRYEKSLSGSYSTPSLIMKYVALQSLCAKAVRATIKLVRAAFRL
jgi:hypothetical protein